MVIPQFLEKPGSNIYGYSKRKLCSRSNRWNGCVDTSACESITGVGVKEVANNMVKDLSKPNNGMVNINLGSNNTSVNYSITSIEGKVVETGKTSTNNIIVDLSKEGNGVYFIRINTESTSTVYKLIKQ
jgi:hypothetical protein